MVRHRLRTVAALAVLTVVAAACTGAPRPSALRTVGKRPATDTPTTPAAAAEAPTPDAAASAAGPAAGATGTAARATKAGTPKPGTSATSPARVGPDPGAAIVPAKLFTAAEDRIGISNTEIHLCAHAALALGAAFDTKAEDLNVYWDIVNARGGIFGRRVTVSYKDDAYTPDVATQAADQCKQENPFILLGGIGFDQIPAVCAWAETNRVLYLHHIAVGPPCEKTRFAFSPQPSVEEVGRIFGEYITNRYATKKIGIVYRQSENWTPGRDTGKAYMKAHGVDIVADIPVNKNQSVFTNEILQLKGKADIVWFWENALAAAEFIKQSYQQDYHPTAFVLFPFQTTLDVLNQQGNSLASRIEGVATWSAYKPGGYATNDFAQFGYGDEIKRFEDAYRTARRTANDITWQVWTANKAIEETLRLCGFDCTRNRIVGMMLGGYHGGVNPNCDVDYRRNPHRGGYLYYTQEAFDAGGGQARFRTTRWCSEHLN
jgi:ABC-type branched-subunit amino acid transport system substrate-binding protein